jgi:AcrR family transcriptional regulator
MGVKERKARQKTNLRQEILAAASELFVKEGYENVSMRRIAEKIEYSPTTIYLYFRDKAELLEQLCNDTFSRLIAQFSNIFDQPGDPVLRLTRVLTAYIQFGLDNPHHYRATFLMPPPEGFDKSKFSQPDSPGIQAFDFLRRSVFDCVSAGKFRSSDTELISQTLWTSVHGLTSLLITKTKGFPWLNQHQLSEFLVITLVRGLSK